MSEGKTESPRPASGVGTSKEELGKWLREQDPEARRAWVVQEIGNPRKALDVAKRAHFQPNEARELVEATVAGANPSTMRCWVEFYASVAGLRRTLRMLEQWTKAGYRDRVQMAAYWVGQVPEARTEAGKKLLAAERERRRVVASKPQGR